MTTYITPSAKYPHVLYLGIKAEQIVPPAPKKDQVTSSSLSSSSSPASTANAASKKEETPSLTSPQVNVKNLQEIEARYSQLSSADRVLWNGVLGKFTAFLKENESNFFLKVESPISDKAIRERPDISENIRIHNSVYAIVCFLGANMEGGLTRVEVESLVKTCMAPGAISILRSVCASWIKKTVSDTKLIDFLFSLTVNNDSLEVRQGRIVSLTQQTVLSLQYNIVALSSSPSVSKDESKSASSNSASKADKKESKKT